MGVCINRPGRANFMPVLDWFAAGLVVWVILGMVVAENKEQGLVQGGNDEIKVVQRQVPGGKYKIDIGEPFLYIGRIDQGIDLIGNTEDFQGFSPIFRIKICL